MKNLTLTALAVSSFLTACGGGGGGTNNTPASISGTSTGSTVKGASNAVSGSLTITDPDAGQATFQSPLATSLNGIYGTFTLNTATGVWTYTLDNTKTSTQGITSGQTVTDVMSVSSQDGTATKVITITISASSGGGTSSGNSLVTSVPTPTYIDTYASEKVAVFNLLNDDRFRCGFGKVAQNTKLDQSAQAHADYIKQNKIPNTHYESSSNTGFTGYDPSARLIHFGYEFSYSNENLAQTYWGSLYSGSGNINGYSSSEVQGTNILKTLYSSIYHLSGLMENTTEIGIGISNNIDTGIPKNNSSGQLMATNAISTSSRYTHLVR